MKKQSFITGAIILTISGIVCKILGAMYKIPLTNILGSQGMGIYYIIFPVYAFLLTFVSSCFTISISKKVSSAMADNNFFSAYKYFKASLLLLSLLGVVLSFAMIIFARLIAHFQGLSNIYVCYFVVAPSIIAVAVQSAFKGFFQGMQNMTPSAVSQVIEQIVKLAVGFSLASLFVGKSILLGVVGALIGILISEVGTCAYFMVSYFAFKIKNKNLFASFAQKEHESWQKDENICCKTLNNTKEKPKKFKKIYIGNGNERKTLKLACNVVRSKYKKNKNKGNANTSYSQTILMKEVFLNAVPFMLSSLIMPLSLVVDSFLIVNILKTMGFDKFFATALLGINSGVVSTLVGLPATVSSSLCTTIVPYITYSLASGDTKSVSQKICMALKLTIIVSLPCFFIFVLFSPNIIRILYSFDSIYEFNVASSMLMISSVNVLYLSILQLTIAILQAFGKTYFPVINLSIGLLFKVIFELIFINIPYLNIFGAIVSNIVCYFVPCALNVAQIKKFVQIVPNMWQTFISPAISSIIMVSGIYASLFIVVKFASNRLSSLISFLIGGILYLVCLFLLKTFSKDEKDAFLLFRLKKKSL